MGDMRYRRHDDQGVAEIPPDLCPAGHPLKPPDVRVGWDGIGRTYTCRVCWDEGTLPHTMRYITGGRQLPDKLG